MYFASPSSGEHFYLQTLLTVVKGAKSFDYLKTVDGTICATFKEACFNLGLLGDDKEWIDCLEDASTMQTGYVLCTLFATILNECHPSQPLDLWEQFKDHICNDLPWWLEHEYPNEQFTEDLIFDFGLFLLHQQLLKFEKTLADFPPMPLPTLRDWVVLGGNFLLMSSLIGIGINYQWALQWLWVKVHVFVSTLFQCCTSKSGTSNPNCWHWCFAWKCGITSCRST